MCLINLKLVLTDVSLKYSKSVSTSSLISSLTSVLDHHYKQNPGNRNSSVNVNVYIATYTGREGRTGQLTAGPAASQSLVWLPDVAT